MMTITVVLHKDRRTLGVATLREFKKNDQDQTLEKNTTFRCLGKADNPAATKHGNPDRDQLKPYGDTPTGEYTAALCVNAGGISPTASDLRSFGPHKRLMLTPKSGNALEAAKNGRGGLMGHGGALATGGGLRPTDGCVRFDDDTMAVIEAAYAFDPRPFPFTVSEV